MSRPRRTDDKYWTGTRNFNHLKYEDDLEVYIDTDESIKLFLQKKRKQNDYSNEFNAMGIPDDWKVIVEFLDRELKHYT